MSRIYLLGIVIVMALAVTARSGARQLSRGSVTGRIIRTDGGDPVAKAIITMGGVSVITGEDGQFAFLQVNPGEYKLSVTAVGYAAAEYGQGYPPRPNAEPALISVAPGARINGIVVPMTAAGVITGRVVDQEGNPVRGAQVESLQYSYQDGWRLLTPVTPVFETDDLGDFRMFWLGPGSYIVRALPPRSATSGEEPAPTYFPGVTDPRAASPIVVRGGDTLGVTLRMPDTRLARIAGTVIDGLSGSPVSAQLVLTPQTPEAAARVYRGASGTEGAAGAFSIQAVPPGSYYLYAAVRAAAGARLVTRVPIDVGGNDVDNLTIVTKPLAVQGRVVIEDWPEGMDPARVRRQMAVQLRLDPPILSVDESRDGIAPRLQSAVTDGAFLFPSVMPADYRVSMAITVAGLADPYVKSIRFLDSDVIDEGLHLDNRTDVWLDVVVGLNGASVGGVVVDGLRQPVRRATVALVPENRKQITLYQDARTDAMGHFQFHGIAPGSYSLFAWEAIETGAWLDADTLGAYETRAAALRVEDGTHMDALELPVIPWRP